MADAGQDSKRHSGDNAHHDHGVHQGDKQDASGVGHVTEKKHGAGKGNWGSLSDEREGAPHKDTVEVKVKTLSAEEFEAAKKAAGQ